MTDIYETRNSRYEIDLPGKRYRRTPLRTPDLDARIAAAVSPRLRYGEWLPLKDIPNPVQLVDSSGGAQALHIMHENSTYGIWTSDITYMSVEKE